MEESSVRIVTRIIAVLAFISALLALGVAAIFGVAGSLGEAGPIAELGSAAAFVGASLAAVFVVIAAYLLVTGIGLWKMRNWGRIMFLVGAWLDFVLGVISLATSFAAFVLSDFVGILIGLAVTGFFIWFFQFNDVVRSVFNAGVPAAAPAEAGSADASFQPVDALMIADPAMDSADAPEPIAAEKPAPAAKPVRTAVRKPAAKPQAKAKPKARKPVKKAAKKAARAPAKKAAKRKPAAKKKK